MARLGCYAFVIGCRLQQQRKIVIGTMAQPGEPILKYVEKNLKKNGI